MWRLKLYLKAPQRSWCPRPGRCPCQLWKTEFRSCLLTSEVTKSRPAGGERTSSPLHPVGIDIGPRGAAALLHHSAPPAARMDLVWRLNGSSPVPTRTHLQDESLNLNFCLLKQLSNYSFSVLWALLTIQGAKAPLVAFPRLIETLGSIIAFLDHRPSTFCSERIKTFSLFHKPHDCLKMRLLWLIREVMCVWPTWCHVTEDGEWLRPIRLDGIDAASPLTTNVQMVTVSGST